jgi:hypothetical protein
VKADVYIKTKLETEGKKLVRDGEQIISLAATTKTDLPKLDVIDALIQFDIYEIMRAIRA